MQHHVEPIRVEVRRGGEVESSHVVHAVVAAPDRGLEGWGDTSRPTMPRSAIKSIQLLPMLATGAADAFDVSDDEIALAAASHSAEPEHTEAVSAWLDRIGLGIDDLECGPSDPINAATTKAMHAAGETPTSLHNCCSGKHTGFLSLALHHAGDPSFALPGYLAPSHGVQVLVRDAQARMTGVDLEAQTPVIDGCGIPVYRFPLEALAAGMARLVTPGAVPDDFAASAERVTAALPSRSFLVSGSGRTDHVLTEAATEPLIIKGGAEGVSMGALPQRRIGFALKCEDGSNRGVDEAVAAVLHRLGVFDAPVSTHSPIHNRAGTEVGTITVAF